MDEQFHSLIKGQEIGEKFALYNGDSAEVLKMMPDESVHYIIYSPPFQSLYVYSNSDRDLGNCRTAEEFYEQFRFIGGGAVQTFEAWTSDELSLHESADKQRARRIYRDQGFSRGADQVLSGNRFYLSQRGMHLEGSCYGHAADKGAGIVA